MSPPINSRIITNTEVSKINYGKSFNVLERANADRYLQTVSSRDVLRENLSQTDLYTQAKDVLSEPDLNAFLTMLSNMYQSVTTKGLTTYEILTYVITEILRIRSSLLNKGDQNKLKTFNNVIAQIGLSMPVFMSNFGEQKKQSALLSDLNLKEGDKSFVVNYILPYFCYSFPPKAAVVNSNSEDSTGDSLNFINTVYGDRNSADVKDKDSIYDITEMLNFEGEKKNNLSVNSDIKTCSKLSPNFSVILLNNRNLRSGLKNGLEISTFFNLITTLELSKAYPYFNATFILPSISKQDKKSIFKTATLNQFLFGFEQNKSDNFNNFEGKIKKNESSIGVETNLSIFTTPQTVVNLNEKIGHSDILNKEEKKLRITSVHDSTRPFMTLKDFTIDVAPTKGLMSFKTGKISLILHDRTRMGDIAPFIKPDLFGAFGAEIMVEYGWVHNESQSTNSNNPIGEFLDSSKCVEKYMITNSQFTVENNGQVNINLSIAMKGPIDIRQTEIFADVSKKIDFDRLNTTAANYSIAIDEFTGSSSNAFQFNIVSSGFSSLKSRKPVNDKILKQITNVRNKLQIAKSVCKKLKNVIPPNQRIQTFKSTEINVSKFNVDNLNLNSIKKSILKNNIFRRAKKEDIIRSFNGVFGLNGSTEGLIETGSGFSLILPKGSSFSKMLEVESSLEDVINNISFLIGKNTNIKETTKKFVETLIGGTKYHDMFFDFDLLYLISNSQNLDKEDILVKKGLFWGGINKGNFVSLGTLISSLIATHMLPSGKYDEIQILFNTVNQKAGLAASYNSVLNNLGIGNSFRSEPLNIASLLINRSDLEKFLKKLFENNTRLTLESLISQIITNFVITRDNPVYGLSGLFERESFDLPVKPITKRRLIKGLANKSVKDQLNFLYYGDKVDLYESNPRFVPPSIHMTFDSLTSPDDSSKTICRITVYDRNDNPYQSMCDLYNQSFTEKSKGFNQLKELEYELKNKKLTTKQTKDITDKINNRLRDLLDEEKGLFEKFIERDKTFYRFKTGFGFKDLKEKYKKIIPTATFATQNTALINASVATVNEGKLNTVYITRADRNNTSELNDKVLLDMPLRILPAQASIETFGCPWINFGQYIFLDFETGTTLDNTYAVTGIQHTISPGTFKTRVSLSYGDVYGKYEGVADGFEQSLSKFGKDIASKDISPSGEEAKTIKKVKKDSGSSTTKKIKKVSTDNATSSKIKIKKKARDEVLIEETLSITLKDLIKSSTTTNDKILLNNTREDFLFLNLFKIKFKDKDFFDIKDFLDKSKEFSALKSDINNTSIQTKFFKKFNEILQKKVIVLQNSKRSNVFYNVKNSKSGKVLHLNLNFINNVSVITSNFVFALNIENIKANEKYFKVLSSSLNSNEKTIKGIKYTYPPVKNTNIISLFNTFNKVKLTSLKPGKDKQYYSEHHVNVEFTTPVKLELLLSLQIHIENNKITTINKNLKTISEDYIISKYDKNKVSFSYRTSSYENKKSKVNNAKYRLELEKSTKENEQDPHSVSLILNSNNLSEVSKFILYQSSIELFKRIYDYIYESKENLSLIGSNIISEFLSNYKSNEIFNLALNVLETIPEDIVVPVETTVPISTASLEKNKVKNKLIIIEKLKDGSVDFWQEFYKVLDSIKSNNIKIYIYNRSNNTLIEFNRETYINNIISNPPTRKRYRTTIRKVTDKINEVNKTSALDEVIFLTNKPQSETHKKLFDKNKYSFSYVYYFDHYNSLYDKAYFRLKNKYDKEGYKIVRIDTSLKDSQKNLITLLSI